MKAIVLFIIVLSFSLSAQTYIQYRDSTGLPKNAGEMTPLPVKVMSGGLVFNDTLKAGKTTNTHSIAGAKSLISLGVFGSVATDTIYAQISYDNTNWYPVLAKNYYAPDGGWVSITGVTAASASTNRIFLLYIPEGSLYLRLIRSAAATTVLYQVIVP
jgi:hypothetical protein